MSYYYSLSAHYVSSRKANGNVDIEIQLIALVCVGRVCTCLCFVDAVECGHYTDILSFSTNVSVGGNSFYRFLQHFIRIKCKIGKCIVNVPLAHEQQSRALLIHRILRIGKTSENMEITFNNIRTVFGDSLTECQTPLSIDFLRNVQVAVERNRFECKYFDGHLSG